MNKKIAVIGAVLEDPKSCAIVFNELIVKYQHLVRGRMGIPFAEDNVSVISITLVGTLNEINSLTGQLGNINGITVKTSISKKEINTNKNA